MSEKSSLNKKSLTIKSVAAGVIMAATLVFLFFPRSFVPKFAGNTILTNPKTPYAVEVRRTLWGIIYYEETNYTVQVNRSNDIEIVRNGSILMVGSSSFTNTGSIRVIIASGKDAVTNTLTFSIPPDDRNGNGYPDAVELGNDQAFRDWFCAITESQFYYPSAGWYDVHKDCAGLIEFAFREALKKHTSEWAKDYKFISDFSFADKRHYYYPDVPFLGKRVFRVKEGRFNPETVDEDFALTAHGSVLRNHSMEFVSRDMKDARKGDIIFFFHKDNLKMPSHSMIYIGNESGEKSEQNFLIYHTGPGDTSKGFIKKISVESLISHPDESWRPVDQNPGFLGVYKWKIIE